jgi:hypothetical protein
MDPHHPTPKRPAKRDRYMEYNTSGQLLNTAKTLGPGRVHPWGNQTVTTYEQQSHVNDTAGQPISPRCGATAATPSQCFTVAPACSKQNASTIQSHQCACHCLKVDGLLTD